MRSGTTSMLFSAISTDIRCLYWIQGCSPSHIPFTTFFLIVDSLKAHSCQCTSKRRHNSTLWCMGSGFLGSWGVGCCSIEDSYLLSGLHQWETWFRREAGSSQCTCMLCQYVLATFPKTPVSKYKNLLYVFMVECEMVSQHNNKPHSIESLLYSHSFLLNIASWPCSSQIKY